MPQQGAIGSFADQFGKAFAKSYSAGVAAASRERAARESAEIKEKSNNLKQLNQLHQIFKSPDPNIRQGMTALYIKTLGMDEKGPEAQILLKMVKTADERTIAFLADAMAAFGVTSKGTVGAKALLEGLIRNPGDFAQQVNEFRARKQQEGEAANIFKRAEFPAGEEPDRGPTGPGEDASGSVPSRTLTGVEKWERARDLALEAGNTKLAKEYDALITATKKRDTEAQKEDRLSATPQTMMSFNEDGTAGPVYAIPKGDTKALRDAMASGDVPIGINLRDFKGLTSKERSEVRAAQAKAAASTSEGLNLLRRFTRSRRAGGFVAKVLTSKAGGLIQQGLEAVGAKDFVEAAAKDWTGLSVTELTQLQNNAQTFMISNIDKITGEQSGRVTEAERQLTERVQRLREAASSPPQIFGALTAMITLNIVHAQGKAMEAGDSLPGLEKLGDPEMPFNAKFNRAYSWVESVVKNDLNEKEKLRLAKTLVDQANQFRLFGVTR